MGTQRRNTRQRKLVLDAVRSMDDHPTADEIYLAVREQDDRISRGTVYRNLNLLAEDGLIQVVRVPGGNRFDWRTEEHAHVTCTACGAVADVMTPYDLALDTTAEDATGYAIDTHYTVFEGLCPACQRRLARKDGAA